MSTAAAIVATLDLRGWRSIAHLVGRPLVVLSLVAAVFVVVAWLAGRRWGARGLGASWAVATAIFTMAGTWWSRQPPELLRAHRLLPLTFGEVRPFLVVGAITLGVAATVVRARLARADGRRALPGARDVAAAIGGVVLALAVLAAGVLVVELTTSIPR